jgi:hypothetical protein
MSILLAAVSVTMRSWLLLVCCTLRIGCLIALARLCLDEPTFSNLLSETWGAILSVSPWPILVPLLLRGIDPISSGADFSIRKSRKAFDEYLAKAKTPLEAAVHNRALSDNYQRSRNIVTPHVDYLTGIRNWNGELFRRLFGIQVDNFGNFFLIGCWVFWVLVLMRNLLRSLPGKF